MADRPSIVHVCTCPVCRGQPCGATAREHKAVNRVLATLDEKSRRLFAGLLARQHGRGGIQRLAEITGLSRNTIRRGRREIACANRAATGRIRRPGGGRQRVEKKIPAS
jgi:hypothetical protein